MVVPQPSIRRLDLGDGRVLTIRPVEPDDVERLQVLYYAMTVDDLHNRFFSVFRPDREWCEHVTAAAARGGWGLVAELTPSTPDEPARIVAEASYEKLANGDGELGITIAEDWRGWLGPVLLDALLDAAAARAVPNLEAQVLVTNAPMLRLARSRGAATMTTDDWTSIRLLFSTTDRIPHWPEHDRRPRVLVETSGGRWPRAWAAEKRGVQVLGCSGPGVLGRRCPALEGKTCPLAAGADAILMAHDPDDEPWHTLSEHHPQLHPGVPVCVEPTPSSEPAAVREVVSLVDRVARTHATNRCR